MKAFLEQKGLDQTGTLTLLMEVAEVLRRSARVVADADAPERPGNQGQGNGERHGEVRRPTNPSAGTVIAKPIGTRKVRIVRSQGG